MNDSIYSEMGYYSREEYLEDLAVQYELDIDTINNLSDVLGQNEDFDGLVSFAEALAPRDEV